MTVGELRDLLKDLPSDALVLQDDPYSEFSHDIIGAEKSLTRISHTTNDGIVYYESWIESNFQKLLSDNPENENEIKQEYKQSVLLYLE